MKTDGIMSRNLTGPKTRLPPHRALLYAEAPATANLFINLHVLSSIIFDLKFSMITLVTGATGKVGQTLIRRYLDERPDGTLRAFCHNRMLEPTDRLEVIKGSIDIRDDVNRALQGVTHVVHLATCKETPDNVIDVTVKGLFWLLEGCRKSTDFRQFILIGGDARPSATSSIHTPSPSPSRSLSRPIPAATPSRRCSKR